MPRRTSDRSPQWATRSSARLGEVCPPRSGVFLGTVPPPGDVATHVAPGSEALAAPRWTQKGSPPCRPPPARRSGGPAPPLASDRRRGAPSDVLLLCDSEIRGADVAVRTVDRGEPQPQVVERTQVRHGDADGPPPERFARVDNQPAEDLGAGEDLDLQPGVPAGVGVEPGLGRGRRPGRRPPHRDLGDPAHAAGPDVVARVDGRRLGHRVVNGGEGGRGSVHRPRCDVLPGPQDDRLRRHVGGVDVPV